MESSSKLAPLKISSNAVTTFESWTKWKRSLVWLLDAKGITCHIRKKAMLLHKGGPDLIEIYDALVKEKEDEVLAAKDQYGHALNMLDRHFKPTVNKVYERYVFRKMVQGDESIEQFVIRLRHQAEHCGFIYGDLELADQIVLGTSNEKLRERIFEQRVEKLYEIVELGKLIESVTFHTSKLSESLKNTSLPSTKESVARIGAEKTGNDRSNSTIKRKECAACGSRRHDSNDERCPAKEKTCFRCDKIGHFSNKCPDKKKKTADDKSEEPDKPATSNSKKRDEVKLVRSDIVESSSDESDFSFAVSSKLPQELEENRLPIIVGGVKLRMYIDSGASRALFDARTWQKLLDRRVQFRNAEVSRQLFPYGKVRPLNVERAVYVRFESGSSSVWAKAYVLAASEGRCESILSSEVAKKLNVLRVGEMTDRSKATQSDVIRRVAISTTAASETKTGKLKNLQLHIPQDKSVSPVAQPCRRVPLAIRKPMKCKTDALLGADIIERVEGATPWVSNVVPVIKKNGELRLCVDMRRANAAVLREHYPIPTFDEIVADLKGAEWFSKIDLHSAYHQVELAPESREITTFVTPDGLFRFKRLFFGIRCAPEMFQRIMQDVLRDLPFVRVFFDDLIIFSTNRVDHELHVKQVLQRLTERGLKINVEKSIFGVTEIEFLGHRISKDTVEPNVANIEAVKNFSTPTCKKDLQSFLGLINFVSRFIPHFSTRTAPLRVLLKKHAVFRWSTTQNETFEELKQSVASMKAAMFDSEARIMLLTDASPVGLGAVLLQQKGTGKTEIVAFASHSLTPAERNYSQIEKEALGLVWGCEKFRFYLLGREFDLITDHKPLETIFSPKSKPNARLERWVIRLQCFDYKIRHISGVSNIADPFSRLLQSSVGTKSCSKGTRHTIMKMVEAAVPKKFSLQSIRERSKEDPEILEIISAIKNDTKLPPFFERIRYELTECDGILLRGDRIVPPKNMRSAIVMQAHEGHPGSEVTKRRLRSKVWWPKMDSEADASVRKCFTCTLVSAPDPPPPIRRTELPKRPWEYVAIDHLGPLPSGDHVLLVVDYFSRFVEFAFTKSTSSASTIKILWKIFARHGFPSRLKSDNAAAFRSEEFEEFLSENGISHVTSPPLFPQANGEVERQNRTILKRLKIAACENKDPEIELCKFILLYNSTVHSVTGVSPAKLLFNRNIDDKLPSIHQPSVLRDEVVDKDGEHKFRGKLLADAKAKATPSLLKPGDLVLLKAKQTDKLSPTFEKNPYTVVDVNDAEVTVQRGQQSFRRSVTAVKRCPQPLLAEDIGTQSRRSSASFSSLIGSADHTQQSQEPPSPTVVAVQSAELSPQSSQRSIETVPSTQSAPTFTTKSGRLVRPPQRLDL